MTAGRSIALDLLFGSLTAYSVWIVVLTLPLLHYTNCGTGINDPMSYAFAAVPFGVRCWLAKMWCAL